MTINDFLEARIAEDEAVAERGGSHNGRGTFANDNYGCLLIQPSRVLAECAAKIAIVAEHGWDYADPYEGWKDDTYRKLYGDTRNERTCKRCGGTNLVAGYGERGYKVAWPCPTLKALASIYADHPDYQQEWSPDARQA